MAGGNIYWYAPGAQLHLQVIGVTGGGEMCFNGTSTYQPIKCKGTLRAHGTKPLEFWRGKVVLERHTKNQSPPDLTRTRLYLWQTRAVQPSQSFFY